MEQGSVPSTANAETPSLNNEDAKPETQVELEDVIKRETHQRVLKESQKFKQRAMEAEAKANSLEEAKLTEQQQYKELAERYKTELVSVKEAKTKLQLESKLLPALSSAGCREVTDAMKLGNNDLLFGADDQLEGVDEYVKDLQHRKPWLFDNGKPSSVNPALPSGGLNVEVNSKPDYASMTAEQLDAEIAALDKKMRAR